MKDISNRLNHWSFAGLLMTNWCNARCESCYLNCGPELADRMPVEKALEYWQGLAEASPGGCRIHITGGEPFGDWPALIELCRKAKAMGLDGLEKVETNAFWATDRDLVKSRISELAEAEMGKLVISADPYHQRFVPVANCRLAAQAATEVLGPQRVQVRWRDWLADGFDTAGLPEDELHRVYAEYALKGRDRYNGRAAGLLAKLSPGRPSEHFSGMNCSDQILGSKHVHICPGGEIMPGVCAGIMIARADATIESARRRLAEDRPARPVLSALIGGGPAALAKPAANYGFKPQAVYASKCHLCRDIRSHLFMAGLFPDELGPAWVYGKHLK
ncbi:MAG: hypothetical protein HZA50_12280 [Planctomycetes bacterium]|nr:hypothetical protein [Planctomycetota bacterium]